MTTKRLRGRPPAEKRRCQVAQLRSEGLSLRQVGERLGVTKQAVFSLLHYAGIGTGPRRMLNLCGRYGKAIGPCVGSVGRFKNESELRCMACVDKDRHAPFRVRLRAIRLASGLSALELAARVGMHASSVLYWERHGRHPKESFVRRLAVALGVDPGVLSGGTVALAKVSDEFAAAMSKLK